MCSTWQKSDGGSTTQHSFSNQNISSKKSKKSLHLMGKCIECLAKTRHNKRHCRPWVNWQQLKHCMFIFLTNWVVCDSFSPCAPFNVRREKITFDEPLHKTKVGANSSHKKQRAMVKVENAALNWTMSQWINQSACSQHCAVTSILMGLIDLQC